MPGSTTPEQAQASVSEKAAALIEATEDQALAAMSSGERALLENSVLFPETVSEEVTVLDKKRLLRPLPIKTAKKIHALLRPLTEAVSGAGDVLRGILQGGEVKQEVKDYDLDMLVCLTRVCDILADFYNWEDVQKAIAEEEITVAELQALVVTQQGLQRNNDFLLIGLRVVIGLMKHLEIATIRYEASLSPNSPSVLSGP